MIVSGAARIIGKLYSSEFVGKLTGNADTATKATQDSVGQQINTTYIKGLSVSGKTVTYTKGDGTTGTITTQDTNTTYSAGTGISLSGTTFSNSGVRSISTGGTNGTISVNTNGTSAEVAVKGLGSAAYTASSAYASSSHTHTKSQITDFPSSLPASDVYSWAKASSKPSYSWSEITDKPSSFTPTSHTHNYAGSSSAGGSATSAVKLDSSAGSATQPVYFSDGKPVVCTYTLEKSVPSDAVFTDTHYTSHLYVGASGGNANATSATSNPYLLCVDNTTNRNSIQLKAGSNMSISATNGVVTFTATDTTYSTATTSANGLMSSSDKSKLDGIAEGANNYTHPTSAGNKHIPSGGSSGQILGYSASGTAAWTNSVSDLVVSGSFSQNRISDSTVGSYSATLGYNCSALGDYCISGGYGCSVSGTAAIALGYNAIADTGQLVIGHWGSSGTGTTSGNASSKNAFVIGNGSFSASTSGASASLSNAFRVTYAGAVIGKAAYQSTGADFAELREWSDGNPNAEDRRGYFVTMEGMNIRIASPGDYICGIISANPSVIGNNDEDWMGRYVFDDFGAFVYEDYEEIDPETGETRTFTRYKENPEYDPTREYEFRADRPEWDYVGLCGVIHVRDDGTCQQNGFCKCAAGGIATASERGYRVLERVNDHIVKVLFYLTGETF